jgi:SAM-dependent methyltransferase
MTFPQFNGYRRRRQIGAKFDVTLSPMLSLAFGLVFVCMSAMLSGQNTATENGVHPLTGRHYANVMGVGGAAWLNRPERESEENVEGALDALAAQGFLKPGMTVAEVGAGTGYVILRIAKRVGPAGKVYANDIQPRMLELLRQNASKQGLNNVETVLGDIADPKLPPGKMDAVILVDVYHEFSQPQKMLEGIRSCLKPGGKLIQFEYRKEDPAVPILPDHKMSVAEAKREVEAEGFKLATVIESLPRQHLLVFGKAIQ